MREAYLKLNFVNQPEVKPSHTHSLTSTLKITGSIKHIQGQLWLNVKLWSQVMRQMLINCLIVHVLNSDLQDVRGDIELNLASGSLNKARIKRILQVSRYFDNITVDEEYFLVVRGDQLDHFGGAG